MGFSRVDIGDDLGGNILGIIDLGLASPFPERGLWAGLDDDPSEGAEPTSNLNCKTKVSVDDIMLDFPTFD